MSKHWKEIADPQKHLDFMTSNNLGGVPIDFDGKLSGRYVYFVRECSFTFQFAHLGQLEEAIQFFSKKVHPSGRKQGVMEHYWQKWSERLPKGLTADSKRERILKALQKAHQDFSKDT